MENNDLEKIDSRLLQIAEEMMREPYNYLLQVMVFAKEAVKNGGSVDVMPLHDLWEMSTGEGEMFYKDFLPRFGTLENYDYNGKQCDIKNCLPETFTLNAKGLQLGQIGLELERLFKDDLLTKKEIMNLSRKRYKELEARLKDEPEE